MLHVTSLFLFACLFHQGTPIFVQAHTQGASFNSSAALKVSEETQTEECDDVLEQLREQENEYLAYQQSNPDDERIKELLANTHFLIEKLKNGSETKTNRVVGIPEIDDPNYKTIGATIAAFRTAGWKEKGGTRLVPLSLCRLLSPITGVLL